MSETIVVNGQAQQVAFEKPINLICHNGGLRIKYPHRVEIDGQASLYHGMRVKNLHAKTRDLCLMVDNTITEAAFCHIPSRMDGPESWLHIIGMVDMALKFIDSNIPFVLKFPETGLHPRQQLGLGDMAIALNLHIESKNNG